MSIYFCGIDLSVTNTGLAVVEYLGESKFNLVDIKSIAPNQKTKGFNRKLESLECFIFAAESFTPIKDSKFFVFENYSFGSPGRLTDLAELAGLYKGHIVKGLEKSFDLIAPQTVKKIITGSGRADKDEVQKALGNFVININDFTFANYDESDAVAVAVSYGIQMERLQNGCEEDKEDTGKTKRSNRRRKSD
jgi:crossover junction endodeoxyribonuclease ruvC|nr:MAG TPA: RuvC [Bacteriophage sp.]